MLKYQFNKREGLEHVMYQYTITQWIIFFFLYCFIGWIWESCYVSANTSLKNKKWKWVNRGFLNGPFLPIYGTAAVTILVATMPFRDNIIYIFLFGALSVTLLELVTGIVTEKLFHVKYWDYSNFPLNYKGYICLFASLFWGVLSILLVRVIHTPIERLVLYCPKNGSEIVSIVAVTVFVFDFGISFREAYDVRQLLEKVTEAKDKIDKLGNRLDALIAFALFPDFDELRERTGNTKEKIFSNKKFLRVTKHLKRNPGAISKKYEEALEEIKELFVDK